MDSIEKRLVEFDEALARGESPELPDFSDENDEDLRADFDFLRLVDQLWPRNSPGDGHSARDRQAERLLDELHSLVDSRGSARSLRTLDQFRHALEMSGYSRLADQCAVLVETSAATELTPSVEQFAAQLIEQNLLFKDQAAALIRGDLDQLLLGDYVVINELGRGGMGIVYRALDRQSNRFVALKSLFDSSPKAIARLKNEFRSLTRIAHRNLLIPDRLQTVGRRWFFTMELVDGVSLSDYVRGVRSRSGVSRSTAWLGADVPDKKNSVTLYETSLASSVQVARLGSAIPQLVEALHALHEASLLHRDIKPSNILVTDEGRLVVLDFGMAERIDTTNTFTSSPSEIGGTIPYMSPEQAEGKRLDPSSDWFSVGVMLWEILTGELPYKGALSDVQHHKNIGPPPLPQLPTELERVGAVCQRLLAPDPAARGRGDELLELFSPKSQSHSVELRWRGPEEETLFVGRKQVLAQLRNAYEETKSGIATMVYVQGESGIGKSFLLDQFLRNIPRTDNSVVLQGRCYAQETVPFKAVDGVVDALTRFLLTQPDKLIRSLLPDEIGSIARVFPALARVAVIKETAFRQQTPVDDFEIRQDAAKGLRELFRRLRERHPIVIAIDDLQWGDMDSAWLIAELFAVRPSSELPLLLVVSYRSEDLDRSSCLQTVSSFSTDTRLDIRQITIPVEPLNESDVQSLVSALDITTTNHELARFQNSALQLEGRPYLIVEMARHPTLWLNSNAQIDQAGMSDLLSRRLKTMPDAAQELLRLVSVAGQPLPMETARDALGSSEFDLAAALLANSNLTRLTGGEADRFDTYHDQVREVVFRQLSPEVRREYNLRVAASLEASNDSDPEWLYALYQGADEYRRAGEYALAAADRAASTLAFNHAAELYRKTIEYMDLGPQEESEIRAKLGDALANDGQSVEAANQFEQAATAALPDRATELLRLAADQNLRAIEMEKGLALLDQALRTVGMKLFTPRQAFFVLMYEIAIRKIRGTRSGLRYRLRPEEHVPRLQLRKVDAYWSAASTLAYSDSSRGGAYVMRHVRLALNSGEPYRVIRALTPLVFFRVGTGNVSIDEVYLQFETIEHLASQYPNPYLSGHIHIYKGMALAFLGQHHVARDLIASADATFRKYCNGTQWESAVALLQLSWALYFTGDIARCHDFVEEKSKAAIDRGNTFQRLYSSIGYSAVASLIVTDDVKSIQHRADAAISLMGSSAYGVAHLFYDSASLHVSAYVNQWQGALRKNEQARSRIRKSTLRFHKPSMAVCELQSVAVSLNGMRSGFDSGALDKQTQKSLRWLRNSQYAWLQPVVTIFDAAYQAHRLSMNEVTSNVESAIANLDVAELKLYAAAARRRLGEYVGGTYGRELVDVSNDYMSSQRIRKPEKTTQMLLPPLKPCS